MTRREDKHQIIIECHNQTKAPNQQTNEPPKPTTHGQESADEESKEYGQDSAAVVYDSSYNDESEQQNNQPTTTPWRGRGEPSPPPLNPPAPLPPSSAVHCITASATLQPCMPLHPLCRGNFQVTMPNYCTVCEVDSCYSMTCCLDLLRVQQRSGVILQSARTPPTHPRPWLSRSLAPPARRWEKKKA